MTLLDKLPDGIATGIKGIGGLSEELMKQIQQQPLVAMEAHEKTTMTRVRQILAETAKLGAAFFHRKGDQ
ncbi:MAG: hypothetical protein EOO40_05070 [Deltaproteobacteria bacterium]|nr:MAG: hypothetical protein EOO40_05070 [Deltaproteobacteria bacterium]